MAAEDPLFILYTSGSTGRPKGVQHSTGGYLLHAAMTHKYVFDYHDGDIYWCTADVGWVTGHSYIVYGPLANGATTLMFEGVPTYPDASRCWQIVDKHQVDIFYTAPDRDPAADGAGRRVCDLHVAAEPQAPRIRRRADQPGSLGVVPRRGRRAALPHRRHLVADRDGRHHDHAAGRRDGPETGFRYTAFLRRAAGAGGRRRQGRRGNRGVRQSRHHRTVAGTTPARSTATISGSSTPTTRRTRASTSPATAPAGTPTATTGSPAGWTT